MVVTAPLANPQTRHVPHGAVYVLQLVSVERVPSTVTRDRFQLRPVRSDRLATHRRPSGSVRLQSQYAYGIHQHDVVRYR
jgi:hypothetical protein